MSEASDVQIGVLSIIEQLSAQQFFKSPNIIVDRTNRIKINVSNSDIVIKRFNNYLFQSCSHLKGKEHENYLNILPAIAEKLELTQKDFDLQERFMKKAGSFIKEGLASESILIITTISTILESLDLKHHRQNIANLKDISIQRNISELDFEIGIKKLGETANSDLSILQNLIKIQDLARMFDVGIKIPNGIIASCIDSVFKAMK